MSSTGRYQSQTQKDLRRYSRLNQSLANLSVSTKTTASINIKFVLVGHRAWFARRVYRSLHSLSLLLVPACLNSHLLLLLWGHHCLRLRVDSLVKLNVKQSNCWSRLAVNCSSLYRHFTTTRIRVYTYGRSCNKSIQSYRSLPALLYLLRYRSNSSTDSGSRYRPLYTKLLQTYHSRQSFQSFWDQLACATYTCYKKAYEGVLCDCSATSLHYPLRTLHWYHILCYWQLAD